MYSFGVELANTGLEDEHQVAVGIRLITNNDFKIVDQQVVRMPIFYGEDYSGGIDESLIGWENRLKLRFEALFDLPCKCQDIIICNWHKYLGSIWLAEDQDAIDSWRESRGDFEAMMRRTRRMILRDEPYLI